MGCRLAVSQARRTTTQRSTCARPLQEAAARLGLSPRTLHRRLRHFMDMAGVRTLMQLGGHAVRHGWVEPH
ncbi:helix-turn-helix domain-containing protein [Streptomyces sp. NBC_01408]|uniref:helix-turn-helix domain-containing protein n=1 Tax=Streptomyces sp. NBC_01408 TaxID=2903855 RepID=UPI0022550C53|nr:helix-turn-helix domain-containing protein [Streptomyces sp. NBC_01408]MCX4696265.1 hypothetical protein [Streptomyces sp. NBC_01408]